MNDIKQRLVNVAKNQIGPSSAKVISNSDTFEFEPYAGNWTDLDICLAIIFPTIHSGTPLADDVKNELMECVWHHCSSKRGMMSNYPALRSVHDTLNLLSSVLIKLFSSKEGFPAFLGFDAFCNLVFWRMNKNACSILRLKGTHERPNSELISLLDGKAEQQSDVLVAQEEAARLEELIERLTITERALVVDYMNKMPYADMSVKYEVGESALRKRVQRIIDRLRHEF